MAFMATPAFAAREDLDSVGLESDRKAHAVARRGHRAAQLTTAQILAWADAHYENTGVWPTPLSGPVLAAPEETWRALSSALGVGTRGLPGGDSVARFLRREGRIGERRGRPPQVARHRLLCRLHAEGMSLAEIGRCLGVSRQAAWQMVRRNAEPACREAVV
jgi:hypothetical protein